MAAEASFNWASQGLNQARFQAYTKLLRLRSGGQVEHLVDSSQFLDDDDEDDMDDAEDGGSLYPTTLCDSHEDKVRRAFLDRLAELVSPFKGGQHVSASLMVQWPDRVEILVAKNSGIMRDDSTWTFLKGLEDKLRRYACARGANNASSIAVEIWHSVLEIYKPRILDYMKEVRRLLKIVKQAKPARADSQPSFEPRLPPLLQKLADALADNIFLGTHDGLRMVVLYADALWEPDSDNVLTSALGKSSNTEKLWRQLGFLARVRRCVDALTIACNTLSDFENVRLVPLGRVFAPTAKVPPATKWTPEKAFSSLNLVLDDRSVKDKMGPAWTKRKLMKEYHKLQSSLCEVHAEVQLVLHLISERIESSQHGRAFRYIGCSKRSCFLCARFVDSCGGYSTRGCHGKLYDLWNVPSIPSIPAQDVEGINNAIRRVEDDVKGLLHRNYPGAIQQARESTVGGTSISFVMRKYSSFPMAELVVQHLREDREANVESWTDHDTHARGGPVEELLSEDIIEPPAFEADQPDPSGGQIAIDRSGLSGECAGCDRETSRHCSLCGLDWFCSERCQTMIDRLPRHLRKCCRGEMTTADNLAADVYANEIPQDEQVRDDYGFDRCLNLHEESNLLGVYIGILKIMEDVLPSQLDEWRKRGELAQRIVELYSQIPPGSQGSYFPWFQKNVHRLLDKSMPPRDPVEMVNRWLDDAKTCLSPDDRTKDPTDLQPPERAECFLFFALAFAGIHPNPADTSDLWYKFGFCSCFAERFENELGVIYSGLIAGDKLRKDMDNSLGVPHSRIGPDRATCSFDEFWQAWDLGNLGVLMEKYQLYPGRKATASIDLGRPPRTSLSVFLSTPRNHPKPSIWRLIHYLSLEPNTPLGIFPGMEEAIREFGFHRRLDAKSKQLLIGFYKTLLGTENCDPMDVQQARDGGRLLEFVQTLEHGLSMEPEVERVLRRLE